MKRVYFSLGSNLGDRTAHLESALGRMEQLRIHILRRSSLYETEPRDLKDQPWFLNLVVEAETSLFPIQLLRTINRIETELGRERRINKGPRTLDIDILLYGNFVISTPLLVVPHPRMTERRFVLEPLAELAPDLRHPVIKRAIRDLLGDVQSQDVRRLSP